MIREKQHTVVIALLFIANLLTLSFNSESLADSFVHDAGAFSHTDLGNDAPPDSSLDCNHGCHILSHLQGQVSAVFAIDVNASVTTHVPSYFFPPLGHRAAQLYRPPRSFTA